MNRNVDNFFAETEQSVFDITNLVPGIDFSNDPILQGRTFTYKVTQMHRLGSINYTELPINRSLCPFHNNQRDGHMRHRIDVDQVNYYKNSIANNTPGPSPEGFAHYPEKVAGRKQKDNSFKDCFSHARMFWNSMSTIEKQHIIESFSFSVGKVESESVRQQVVNMFVNVDKEMATTIAENVGVKPPAGNHVPVTVTSPAVSQANTPKFAFSLKVGVLIGEGFNGREVMKVMDELKQNGIFIDVISDKLGTITGTDGAKLKVNKTFLTTHHVLLDALYVVGGRSKNQKVFDQHVDEFMKGAYKSFKPIGVATTGKLYIQHDKHNNLEGVVFADPYTNIEKEFVSAVAHHRFWNRK